MEVESNDAHSYMNLSPAERRRVSVSDMRGF